MADNNTVKYIIKVGEGSCGIAAGAAKVYAALERELCEAGTPAGAGKLAGLTVTGCIGMLSLIHI